MVATYRIEVMEPIEQVKIFITLVAETYQAAAESALAVAKKAWPTAALVEEEK